MNPDAFGIRVRRRRTIAPRLLASVSPHVRAVNLDFHKWHTPGELPLPATGQQPVGSGLGRGLRAEKAGLVPSHEHGWKTSCRLWGLHPITNCETYGPVQSQLPSTPGKIYETALHIGVNEFDANVIAHF